MKPRCHAIVSAAIAAVFPIAARAAVITVSFDMNDIRISPTSTGTFVSPSTVAGASLVGTSAAPILTVPAGYYVRYGLDGFITNNGGLGLSGFQVGANNSNPSISLAQTTSVKVNPFFSSLMTKGSADGAGGVSTDSGTAGVYIVSSANAGLTYGVSAPAELFNSLQIKPLGIGTTKISITDLPNAFSYIEQGSTSGYYIGEPFEPGLDTISPLPALTINIGVPEPTTLALTAIAATTMLLKRRKTQ